MTELTEIREATDRLLATVAVMPEDDVRAPSLLSGWSRGHVLAHLARNADGLVNLVTWARTGVETPAYASQESRNADIERGAPRGLAEHRADLEAAASGLVAALNALPADRMDAPVRTASGPERPARDIAWLRLMELEIHHVDLGAGYTPESWPEAFVDRALEETARRFAGKDDAPGVWLRATDGGGPWEVGKHGTEPEVIGPRRSLFAWLCGRRQGKELSVVPDRPLPALPTWP